jgi:hypothetical protein
MVLLPQLHFFVTYSTFIQITQRLRLNKTNGIDKAHGAISVAISHEIFPFWAQCSPSTAKLKSLKTGDKQNPVRSYKVILHSRPFPLECRNLTMVVVYGSDSKFCLAKPLSIKRYCLGSTNKFQYECFLLFRRHHRRRHYHQFLILLLPSFFYKDLAVWRQFRVQKLNSSLNILTDFPGNIIVIKFCSSVLWYRKFCGQISTLRRIHCLHLQGWSVISALKMEEVCSPKVGICP